MGIGNVLNRTFLKAQSVIPVPLKMEQGTGCFYCQRTQNFI